MCLNVIEVFIFAMLFLFLTRHMSICIANYNDAVLLSRELGLITENKKVIEFETISCL